MFKKKLYHKIVNKESDIIDFIQLYDYPIFQMKIENIGYIYYISDIYNKTSIFVYDILYLAIRYKHEILIDYLVKNIEKCDLYNILDRTTEDYRKFGSTFFYAYCHYPKVAYKMFEQDKNIAFIETNEVKSTIIHRILRDSDSKDRFMYGLFLDVYKEKLKIKIYDHIIETEGFDYFIKKVPNFFTLLFSFGLTLGRNINFIDYILNKEINKDIIHHSKINELLKYQSEDKTYSVLIRLITPSHRHKECIDFAKKIMELCPKTVEQKVHHQCNNKKMMTAYEIAKMFEHDDFAECIETFVKTYHPHLKYK